MAVKVMELDKIIGNVKLIDSLRNEICTHWILGQCSAVPKLLELYLDSSFIYIIMDYIEHGSILSNMINMIKFSESQAKMIMI